MCLFNFLYFWGFNIWCIADPGEDYLYQAWWIVRDRKWFTFEQAFHIQSNKSRAHTSSMGLSHSGALSPYPNLSGAKYQIPRGSLCAPESTNIIQTSQSSAQLTCPAFPFLLKPQQNLLPTLSPISSVSWQTHVYLHVALNGAACPLLWGSVKTIFSMTITSWSIGLTLPE